MATWYVRPDTSHSGTRNGTSYATAWGGWSSIVWGGAGVTAGDTLYVCGAHTYGSTITVGNHGGTTTNRTTIRGDFALDPGSITFTGANYLSNFRANTIIRNISFAAGTSHCIFVQGLATLCDYLNNTFTSLNSAQPAFSLYGGDGENFVDVLLQGNRFVQCAGAGAAVGKATAIEWFPSDGGAASTLTRVKILGNSFIDCNSVGSAVSVVQLRVDPAASTSCSITDLQFENNIFQTYKGAAFRTRDDHTGSTYNRFKGIKCRNNQFFDGDEATAGFGGAMSIGSFGLSTTQGWGRNEITGNVVKRVKGASGGVNLFYGAYDVSGNTFEDLSTTSIDGNAILLDFGCQDVSVLNNTWRNIRGKDGVTNSGCGIMVLDSTNVRCYGNVGSGMRIGIYVGDKDSGQSAKICNNTMWNCSVYAIYMHPNADLSGVTMYNNAFQGNGFKVYKGSVSAWSLENYNNFDGFGSGTYQHTLGANDKSESMTPYVRPDGSLKVPSTATIATVGTDNPLATSGTYVPGVTLANGRLRPGYVPIGAYMAVVPRAARA